MPPDPEELLLRRGKYPLMALPGSTGPVDRHPATDVLIGL
jgi:hypothetical protein